jgi:hypothetical protein
MLYQCTWSMGAASPVTAFWPSTTSLLILYITTLTAGSEEAIFTNSSRTVQMYSSVQGVSVMTHSPLPFVPTFNLPYSVLCICEHFTNLVRELENIAPGETVAHWKRTCRIPVVWVRIRHFSSLLQFWQWETAGDWSVFPGGRDNRRESRVTSLLLLHVQVLYYNVIFALHYNFMSWNRTNIKHYSNNLAKYILNFYHKFNKSEQIPQLGQPYHHVAVFRG